MKNKNKVILSWLLVLLWLLIIFLFSNMDTTKSNGASKGTINTVVDTTIETSNNLGIIEEIPTQEEKQTIVNNLNLPLRKCTHFTVYLVLAILLLNALTKTNIKNKYFLTLIICFIYALTDEYHQTFITGRTGQFIDVIIDTLGSSLGIIIYRKLTTKKQKRDKFDLNINHYVSFNLPLIHYLSYS